MPRGDGTGPAGHGSMTGRGAGLCAGFASPGCARGGRFGFGTGRGYGRQVFRGACYPGMTNWGRTPDAEAGDAGEKAQLLRRADILEKQLDQVKKRHSLMNKDA